MYQNPVLPGFYSDPSVCRAGDDYYLVTSSFGYFPGVPIFHSLDLIHWKQIGHVLDRKEQLDLTGESISRGGIYAPVIRHHNGMFYMITTNVGKGGNFFVTATNPAGPWSNPIFFDKPEEGGIDPSLFFEGEDMYFTGTGNGRIRQLRLDPVTGQQLDEPRSVWPGTGGQYPEGPHLFKRSEFYYMTLAEGGTEYMHMQSIARSKTQYGPWEACPHNPILSHRSLLSDFHATGHSDFIEAADGTWWLVFHAIRPVDYPKFHVLGRETCLAPVTWTTDGWPVVNGGQPITAEINVDTLPLVPCPTASTRDDFDAGVLGFDWNYLRNPVFDHYDLSSRPGWLGLVPSVDDLNGAGQPTFVGRRQRMHACTVTARFDCSQLCEPDEAGLVVFQNEEHHYEIAAHQTPDGLRILVRRRIGDLTATVADISAQSDDVQFQVKATPTHYTFAVGFGSGPFVELTTASARYLGTEVAGYFTGVYFGVYASSPEPRAKPGAWVDFVNID